MTVKIYNVIGMGFVIGEKIESDDKHIYLKHPGIFIPNYQTRQGQIPAIADPVPEFFVGKNDLLKRFPIKRIHIVFSGKPDINLMALYQQHENNLRQRMSGIRLVSADALSRLPKTGQGGPVLQ